MNAYEVTVQKVVTFSYTVFAEDKENLQKRLEVETKQHEAYGQINCIKTNYNVVNITDLGSYPSGDGENLLNS